ncbi:MAG: hypothetical protein IKG80_00780 [Clostridia bacterium]|nr:hypothetical protein [Clostridia bacterium]
MNNTDDREARFDRKQIKQNIVVTAAVTLFFILSAFTFMNFLYCLSNCVGSIVCASPDVALRDAIRSCPIFLSFFLSLSGLLTAHTFYRNESPGILRKKAKKHAVIGIALGAVIIVYVIVMLITGKYLSITEGAPSRLYPLDAVIYAAGFIAAGIAVLTYLKKAAGRNFVGPCRAPVWKKCRGLRSFFRTFWLLFGLYGFCGFFYSFFIVDWGNGYVLYSVASMCVSFVAFISLWVWEFIYNNMTEEKRKKATLPLGLVYLVLSVGAAAFYFIALKNNLDGPSNVGFGLLPIAFSANVNIATFLVVAAPIIVSLTAVIKGLFRRRKSKN